MTFKIISIPICELIAFQSTPFALGDSDTELSFFEQHDRYAPMHHKNSSASILKKHFEIPQNNGLLESLILQIITKLKRNHLVFSDLNKSETIQNTINSAVKRYWRKINKSEELKKKHISTIRKMILNYSTPTQKPLIWDIFPCCSLDALLMLNQLGLRYDKSHSFFHERSQSTIKIVFLHHVLFRLREHAAGRSTLPSKDLTDYIRTFTAIHKIYKDDISAISIDKTKWRFLTHLYLKPPYRD